MFYISYLGLLIALILFLYRNKELGHNYTLAIFYLTNSIFGIVHNTIFSSENPSIVALLTIHFTPFYFLVGPSLFLFVKRTYITPFREKVDKLHFIIPLIVLINILPYVLMPWSDKLTLAKNIISNSLTQYNYTYWLIPGIFQSILRPAINIIYTLFALNIIISHSDKVLLKSPKKNKVFKYWITLLTVNFLLANLSSLGLVSNLVLQKDYGINIFHVLPLDIIKEVIVVSFFIENIIILFVPYFLFSKYFTSEFIIEKRIDVIFEQAESRDLQQQNLGILNEEKIEEISAALKKITEKDDYLTHDFSLSKLAIAINIPYHVLTVYFSKFLKVSFPEWKNRQRIEFVKNKLKEGAATSQTLESIGEMAGFNSRGAFIKVFKKYTGETPSEYLKKLWVMGYGLWVMGYELWVVGF